MAKGLGGGSGGGAGGGAGSDNEICTSRRSARHLPQVVSSYFSPCCVKRTQQNGPPD